MNKIIKCNLLFSLLLICGADYAQNYKFSKKPVWQDEFNYKGYPDANKWHIDTANNPSGRGTYYRKSSSNLWVSDGTLRLKITKDGDSIHSARIQSKNVSVGYGRLDIRAKCPVVQGVWPALYLRGTERNPYFGEMDILEYWSGYKSQYFQSNYHVWGTFAGKKGNHVMHPKKIACDVSKYHVYSYINFPDSSEIQVDGNTVFSITRKDEPSWPFYKASDIIFALAYLGKETDDVNLPQRLTIDWVRYYPLISK